MMLILSSIVLDDSIVRGLPSAIALSESYVHCILKEIIVASPAPQIRYPDCYGIDMSQIDKFSWHSGLVDLLHERNLSTS